MLFAKKDGNVTFFIELRLCCVCCRMINLNRTSYLIGQCQGITLYSHNECPPTKPFIEKLRPRSIE